MLDVSNSAHDQIDARVAELGALPIAPMPMRTQTLFGEDRVQPGLFTRLLLLFATRTRH